MRVPKPSTFSIVAFDRAANEIGVAVPWVRAGAGAIATQAFCNTRYGPLGLAALAEGRSAHAVRTTLTEDDDGRDDRQVGIVDRDGGAATWTGSRCVAWAGGRIGDA
jgi:uncharacterized Ntn-hydrolase superfamily protein